MSDNGEIFDFLRTRFARLEERLDRVDTRLDKRSVDFAAMQDRLNNFERRLARIERARGRAIGTREGDQGQRAIAELA